MPRRALSPTHAMGAQQKMFLQVWTVAQFDLRLFPDAMLTQHHCQSVPSHFNRPQETLHVTDAELDLERNFTAVHVSCPTLVGSRTAVLEF